MTDSEEGLSYSDSGSDFSGGYSDDDFEIEEVKYLDPGNANSSISQFSKDVEMLMMEDVVVSKVFSCEQTITFEYDCSLIPDYLCSIIGIEPDTTMVFSFDFANSYLYGNQKPTYKVENLGTIEYQVSNSISLYLDRIHRHFIELFESGSYKSQNGYLIGLFKLIKNRILHPGSYCINCDKKHNHEGLVPVSCGSDLCFFQSTELGLIQDLYSLVKTKAQICDLLLCFTYATCKNVNRRQIVFPDLPEQLMSLCDNNSHKAYELIIEILNKIPSVEDMRKSKDKDELKVVLFKIHRAAGYLLRWIITTANSHLELIDKKDKLFADTCDFNESEVKAVFRYLSNPPEKERKFNEYKKKSGVIVHHGYHGSPIENWHSIIRTSLKNYSGQSGKQLHGAAYGNGVYLASDSRTSLGYMGNGQADSTWKHSIYKSIKCMVYCKIIDDGSEGYTKKGTYYVIPNDDLIRTEYLIVL